ncbi:MAG: metal ABC transporter solute-binding protein, Zn/Mn family [Bacteroidales bacterium]
MKKTKLIGRFFIIILSVSILVGCAQQEKSQTIVTVSIAPLQYFVDRLTGETLEVNVMVPQGASHGTYSPTARQIQKLSDSGIYFQVPSLGYEESFIRRLDELNPDIEHINLGNYIELIRGERIKHGDHYHEGGIDPHIWMSPGVMISLLPVMRDAIIKEFPQLEETVNANYINVLADVEATHQALMKLSETLSTRRFLIFHPALTYLARDYNLEQVSIEHEGKEPSPAQLSQLISQARAEDIPVIFIQEEYDVRNARLISEETGAEVVQINPLAYDWLLEMEKLQQSFKIYLQ